MDGKTLMLDTIIKNGTIVDGTGRLRYKADIGIQDGHIRIIGKIQDASAKHLIDASTLIIAPGFIDMHSHSDMSLFDDPGGESKAFQGVTTEVTGNCSYSAFPIAKDRKGDLGMGSMDWPVEWEWNDLDGWANALESKGISINIAPQLGQAALQVAVGAVEERLVTKDEMKEMQKLAEESIEQGAFALSTGLSLSPSGYMQTAEVSELMKVLSKYEGVFYVTHSRFGAGKHVSAIEEAVEIGKTASVPVHYSHLAIIARPDLGGWRQPEGLRGHGPEMLEVFENAKDNGMDITYDTYPFTAAGAGVDQLVPIWAQAGGTETYMQRLKTQTTRDAIRKEVAAGTGGVPPCFDTWVISDVESAKNQSLVGQSIAEIAKQRDVDPAEATLQLEEEERGAVSAVVHGRAERDVEYFLSHPIGMIGSDGNAVSPTGSQSQKQIHPRFYGTYPRILGRYVRERSLISLETAIRKMTGMPAARLGMNDRGQVLEGFVADLVLFDQKKIIDHSTFDKPHQLSEGVQYLLVNGEHVISNGVHTQSRAGRVLRRSK